MNRTTSRAPVVPWPLLACSLPAGSPCVRALPVSLRLVALLMMAAVVALLAGPAAAQPRVQLPGDRLPSGELVLQLDDSADGDTEFELMTRRQARVMSFTKSYMRAVTVGIVGGAVAANLGFGGLLPTIAGALGGGLFASWLALNTGPVAINGTLMIRADLGPAVR